MYAISGIQWIFVSIDIESNKLNWKRILFRNLLCIEIEGSSEFRGFLDDYPRSVENLLTQIIFYSGGLFTQRPKLSKYMQS